MSKKNLILGLLVVLNAVLLAAVVLYGTDGRPAFAQQANISPNYLAVAAEIADSYDALYVLDVADRRLNMFIPSKGGLTRMNLVASRDLNGDFRVQVNP
jgi:hypothetical protein